MLEVIAKNELSVEEALAAHAEVIRALGKRAIRDIIEIGRRLKEAKASTERGGWLPWLDREFGWTDDTALNFMRCHDLAKTRNFRDLSIGASSLYLLATPGTPEEVMDEVQDRTSRGEKLTTAEVKKLIKDAQEAVARTTEQKISKLKEEFATKEEEIREQYADSMTAEDVAEKLEEALEPLQKKLREYEIALKKRKPGPADTAQEKAEKTHAEKLHRKYLLENFKSVLRCLNYKTEYTDDYLTDLRSAIEEAGSAETKDITTAKIQRATDFLNDVNTKWRIS